MILQPTSPENLGGLIALRLAAIDQPEQALYFTLETGNYSASRQQSESGPFIEHRIQFSIPQNRTAVDEFLDSASLDRLAANVTLANGNALVIGTAEHPLRLASQFESGSQIADFNHYQITLICRTPIL